VRDLIAIKICGITEPTALHAAAAAGARYVGLVFYPRSPRAVTVPQARDVLRQTPAGLQTVALCVDPDDALLAELATVAGLDMLQLHGAETPRRVAAIQTIIQRPILKALPVATAADFAPVASYAPLVAQFLFDAKPASGALPGGNALAFDWRLLAGRSFPRPWFLAGGLNPDNVAAAISISGATQVDVSSGVEDPPGHKHAGKIATFCQRALGAAAANC
jgi:phosphoribosylanthranilate isomerase